MLRLINLAHVSKRVSTRVTSSNNLSLQYRLAFSQINHTRTLATTHSEESVKEAEKSAKTGQKSAKTAEDLAKIAVDASKIAKISADRTVEAAREAEALANAAEESVKTAKEAALTAMASKGWRNRKNREEFYAALASLQGLAIITGVGIFYWNEKNEREKRKAALGRKITKDIEEVKTKLKFLINELDESNRTTDSWKGLNKEEIDKYVKLEKINKFEETFSFSMRMVSRYDTGLVPQILQIEADYQNERVRRLAGVLLQEKGDIEKTKQNLEMLRKCFLDVYNVLNIVGLVTAANTIEAGQQSDEQKLLLKFLSMNKRGTFKDKDGNSTLTDEIRTFMEQYKVTSHDDIIIDEIREITHQFRKKQLDALHGEKSKRNIDNSKLVRDEVFTPTSKPK